MSKLIMIAFWWMAFCATHSLLVHPPFKTSVLKILHIDNQTYRLLYSFISVTSLFFGAILTLLSHGTFLKQPDWVTYVGGSILMAGSLYLMRESFKNYSLTVFIGLMAEEMPQLKMEGMNRYVRHPLYLSTILFLTGMIVFWPSDVIVISGLTLIAYTFIGARLEERKLIRTFGKSYTDYMKEVPSIFPNLKDFGIAEYFRKKNNSIS